MRAVTYLHGDSAEPSLEALSEPQVQQCQAEKQLFQFHYEFNI